MRKSLCLISSLISILFGQISLDVVFTPYVTYYVSSIDLNTGSSDMPLFNASLSNDNYPADPNGLPIIIEFEITINSEVLDMYDETLIKVVTDSFRIKAPIILNNQDFTIDTKEIFDVEGRMVPFNVTIEEQIDISEAEVMFSTIVQTGKLPNGMYRFTVKVLDGEGLSILDEDEQVINVSSPSYLQLMSPGGELADTTDNEVFTAYPVFQWESDPCNVPGGCYYFVRVAEFDPGQHSTAEEAIESLTRLPLDQNQGFHNVGAGMTSFQYPTVGAADLEPGKVYVWQILKMLGTTAGNEGILSEIYAFKIKDFTATTETPGGEGAQTPEMMALQSLIGDDQYNSLFGDGGQYQGFATNGNISLDGNSIDLAIVQSLLAQGVSDTTYNCVNGDWTGRSRELSTDGFCPIDGGGVNEEISYRPMNVISVEVEE